MQQNYMYNENTFFNPVNKKFANNVKALARPRLP